MTNHKPWFAFYVDDYLGDTGHLNGAESGAYHLLLCQYWRVGPLPDDDDYLAAIAKTAPKAWKAMRAKIRAFFTVGDDGSLHQKRMDIERAKCADIVDKRREAGRKGGRPNGHIHPNQLPLERPPDPSMTQANAKQMLITRSANAEQKPEVCQRFATVLPEHLPVQSHVQVQTSTVRKESKELELNSNIIPMSRARVEPTTAQRIGVETQIGRVARSLATTVNHALGKKPERDREQQIQETLPAKSMAKPLNPEQLTIARRLAGYGGSS